MEDVRPILMNEQTRLVLTIVGISADMGSTVDEQNALPPLARNALRENASSKSRADDQPVKHYAPCTRVES